MFRNLTSRFKRSRQLGQPMSSDSVDLAYSEHGTLIDTFDHLPPCTSPVVPPVQIKLLKKVKPSQRPLRLKESLNTTAAYADLGVVRSTRELPAMETDTSRWRRYLTIAQSFSGFPDVYNSGQTH
jgi:hypothetical protein